MVVKTVHIELKAGWVGIPRCGYDVSDLFSQGPEFRERQFILNLGSVLSQLDSLRSFWPGPIGSFDLIVPRDRSFVVDVTQKKFVIGREWLTESPAARKLIMTAQFYSFAPRVDVASLHLLAERVDRLLWGETDDADEEKGRVWLGQAKRLGVWCDENPSEPWGHRSCDSLNKAVLEPLSLKKYFGQLMDSHISRMSSAEQITWLRSRLAQIKSLPSLRELAASPQSLVDLQRRYEEWGARSLGKMLSSPSFEPPVFDLIVVSENPVENWRELVELRNWLLQRPVLKVVLKMKNEWYLMPQTEPVPFPWPSDIRAKQVAIIGCSDELRSKDILSYGSAANLVAFIKSCNGKPMVNWKNLISSIRMRPIGRITESAFVNFRPSAIELAQKHGVLSEDQNLMNIPDLQKRLGWSSVTYSPIENALRPSPAPYDAVDSYR